MSAEKWVAGTLQGLTWASVISSSVLNSIASGNAIMGDLNFDNSTNLDIFCDVSIHLDSAAFVAPNYIGIYLYPLDQDGSTYGDGRFAASAAGPPPATYFVGAIGLVAATQAQNGTLRGIVLPPGQFKFVLFNQGGVSLAGSTLNVMKFRTYNRAVT